MKNLLLFAAFLMASFNSFGNTITNTPFINETYEVNYCFDNGEDDSCWWCISEDILGAFEGGGLGGLCCGPIGSAIGAAGVGAYRSIHEHNSQKATLTTDGSSDSSPNGVNEFDFVGLAHNKIVRKAITEKVNILDVNAFYNLAIAELRTMDEFKDYTISPELKEKIIQLLTKISKNQPTSVEVHSVYSEIQVALQTENNQNIPNLITQLEQRYANDDLALMGISVFKYSHKLWE